MCSNGAIPEAITGLCKQAFPPLRCELAPVIPHYLLHTISNLTHLPGQSKGWVREVTTHIRVGGGLQSLLLVLIKGHYSFPSQSTTMAVPKIFKGSSQVRSR